MTSARTDWIIIDGYSLLHRDPALHPLLAGNLVLARQLLIRKVEETAGQWAERITVVFDGKREAQEQDRTHHPIEVVYAPARYTADTVIERLVGASDTPDRILVITSDRAERDTVSAAGADSWSCGDFLAHCQSQRTAACRPRRTAEARRPTLGDYFPG